MHSFRLLSEILRPWSKNLILICTCSVLSVSRRRALDITAFLLVGSGAGGDVPKGASPNDFCTLSVIVTLRGGGGPGHDVK